MKEAGKEGKGNLVVRNRKERISEGPLKQLREIPTQRITGVLLHPLA